MSNETGPKYIKSSDLFSDEFHGHLVPHEADSEETRRILAKAGGVKLGASLSSQSEEFPTYAQILGGDLPKKAEDPSEFQLHKENGEKDKKATIICGFPGIGKTSFSRHGGELKIVDSDSSSFSWADPKKKVRHPNWPVNYIDQIKEQRDHSDIILVSSHSVVRDALIEAHIPFTLVYPGLEMKEEYIQRYVQRGNSRRFIQTLRENYSAWIGELMAQKECRHVVLQSGEYLSNVIADIYETPR